RVVGDDVRQAGHDRPQSRPRQGRLRTDGQGRAASDAAARHAVGVQRRPRQPAEPLAVAAVSPAAARRAARGDHDADRRDRDVGRRPVVPQFEVGTGRPATASVIWLHGHGADGHDFEPIVPELDLPDALAVRFVFPHAPMQPVTINGGAVMRAWYDVYALEGQRREDAAGVRASQAHVEELIASEKKRGVAASRIVLAGFSQGGAIALHTGLRHAERLAGIMALSTYLPVASALAAEA